MSVVRLLRGTMIVLLLGPMLSPFLAPPGAPGRSQVVASAGMACCTNACGGCEKCEASPAGHGCAIETAAGGTSCRFEPGPCHRPAGPARALLSTEPGEPTGSPRLLPPEVAARALARVGTGPSARTPCTPDRPPRA